MAYTKTNWIDNETSITAEKMNNIENGIETIENAIPEVKTSKTTSDTNIYSCSYINNLEEALKTNNVLWYDATGSYMISSQTAQLSQSISSQKNGIVLAFSPYTSGGAQNYDWNFIYVPKYFINMPGTGIVCKLSSSNYDYVGTKYIYVNDTYLGGAADNKKTGTGTGSNIVYNNAYWVMRAVIGV